MGAEHLRRQLGGVLPQLDTAPVPAGPGRRAPRSVSLVMHRRRPRAGSVVGVPHVLIAADAPWVHEEVGSALPADATVRNLINGAAVRTAVSEETPDLIILDSQISNMGAMAVTYDLRNEESGGRLPHVPVLILLDRPSDVYLAQQCKAEGYLVKPLDPLRLRRATTALLGGGTFLDKMIQSDASTNYKATPDSTAR